MDKPSIVDLEQIEEKGNVIIFGNKKAEGEVPDDFTIDTFLTNIEKTKDTIDHFFFIGLTKDGDNTVSAKADSNLHLHWILKRFITHLEQHLYG